MQVHGPAHLHGVHGISAPLGVSPARGPEQTAALTAPRDEVQISDVGRFVEQTHSLPEIRLDRVQQLRSALASGTYDVESKLDLTVSRLLDELG